MNEWKDIKSAPKDGTFVLVSLPSGYIMIMQYAQNGYWRKNAGGMKGQQPTHWMPLPEPPQ